MKVIFLQDIFRIELRMCEILFELSFKAKYNQEVAGVVTVRMTHGRDIQGVKREPLKTMTSQLKRFSYVIFYILYIMLSILP